MDTEWWRRGISRCMMRNQVQFNLINSIQVFVFYGNTILFICTRTKRGECTTFMLQLLRMLLVQTSPEWPFKWGCGMCTATANKLIMQRNWFTRLWGSVCPSFQRGHLNISLLLLYPHRSICPWVTECTIRHYMHPLACFNSNNNSYVAKFN